MTPIDVNPVEESLAQRAANLNRQIEDCLHIIDVIYHGSDAADGREQQAEIVPALMSALGSAQINTGTLLERLHRLSQDLGRLQ